MSAITGRQPEHWALVVFKELADNGIDNAEADTAPKISIAVTITDYGAGIDREDLARVLDYNNRVSSTPACVSPTRGQQGSALQAVLAILFASTMSAARPSAKAGALRTAWVAGCGDSLLPGCDQSFRRPARAPEHWCPSIGPRPEMSAPLGRVNILWTCAASEP
jgi:hypothetical protein